MFVPPAHAGKPFAAGPADQAHQEGFRQVVPVVRQRKGTDPGFFHHLPEAAEPLFPAGVFVRPSVQPGPFNMKRNAELPAESGAESFVAVAFRPPQPVVHVDRLRLNPPVVPGRGQQEHQRRAVRPAAESGQHPAFRQFPELFRKLLHRCHVYYSGGSGAPHTLQGFSLL